MKTLLITFLAVAVIGISVLGFLGVLPGSSGVVSSKTLTDGTKLIVAQQFSGELGYEVGFYIKQPDQRWGWCYLDHQDSAWQDARIDYDSGTDTVSVWRGTILRGCWDRGLGKWERPDISGWSTDAPQDLKNPPSYP